MKIIYLSISVVTILSCAEKAELSAKLPVGDDAYVEVPAVVGAIVQSVSWRGQVSPSEKIDIMVDAKTKIGKTIAKNGMRVKKGDVLFELDKTEEKKNLREKKENYKKQQLDYKSAILQFKNTEKTYGRKSRLFKRGVIARQEFENAELAHEQGKNSLQRKKLEMQKLRNELKELAAVATKSEITSPRSGVVSSVAFLAPGTDVNLGTKLCTISDPDSLALTANVREEHVNQLTEGMELKVSIDSRGEEGFMGRLLSKARSGTYVPQEGGMVYEITVELPDDLKGTREGSSGTIEFVMAEKQSTLTVPKAALKVVGDEHFVLIGGGLVGDPRSTAVKVGIQTATEVEILEGLSEGQTVLIQPLGI